MTTHAELIRTKREDAELKGPEDMRALMDEELDAVSGGGVGLGTLQISKPLDKASITLF